MPSLPKSASTLLRLEGVGMVIAMLIAYQSLGQNWWWFLLILLPDLSMLGYLGGAKLGGMSYNVAHTYMTPLALAALSLVPGMASLLPFAIIWAAHIGADRMLGYGLKFPGGFGMTHLGPVGRAREESHAHAG